MRRIKPIDGLRAFAAFGVIWIHSWMFCKNASLNIFSIDLYKIIAIVGNGVDFFFVISGFCMYLMIKKNSFSINYYLNFIYKRFLRIAPAFYLSVIVYAAIIKSANPDFPFFYNVFFHFLFLNNVVTGNTISGPFWSIGVEWHFYLLLPLLIVMSQRIALVKTVILLSVISISFFCLATCGFLHELWWENQVIVRFPEFGCGIIAAFFYTREKRLPKFLAGKMGLFIGLVVMYLGRLMMFTPILTMVGNFAFIFKAGSYTIMTSGFALILFHVITEKSRLSTILSARSLTYLGKISYSIYLWHSLSFILWWKYIIGLRSDAFNVFVVFILISLLTILIANYSYKFLESFYFKNNKKIIKNSLHVYAN